MMDQKDHSLLCLKATSARSADRQRSVLPLRKSEFIIIEMHYDYILTYFVIIRASSSLLLITAGSTVALLVAFAFATGAIKF